MVTNQLHQHLLQTTVRMTIPRMPLRCYLCRTKSANSLNLLKLITTGGRRRKRRRGLLSISPLHQLLTHAVDPSPKAFKHHRQQYGGKRCPAPTRPSHSLSKKKCKQHIASETSDSDYTDTDDSGDEETEEETSLLNDDDPYHIPKVPFDMEQKTGKPNNISP